MKWNDDKVIMTLQFLLICSCISMDDNVCTSTYSNTFYDVFFPFPVLAGRRNMRRFLASKQLARVLAASKAQVDRCLYTDQGRASSDQNSVRANNNVQIPTVLAFVETASYIISVTNL